MIFFLIYIIILFLLNGCEKPIYDYYEEMPNYNNTTKRAVYEVKKFHQVLEESKLQYPNSSAVINYGDFEGKIKPYFFLNEQDNMVFMIDKKETDNVLRAELHQGPASSKGFSSNISIKTAVFGKVRCYYSPDIKNYTWMQIHASHPFSYPIIRLTVLHSKNGKKDHIWAVMMNTLDIQAPRIWFDLGKRPEKYFDFEVDVKNNQLYVLFNNKEVLHQDISFWEGKVNYFKIGAYITRHKDIGKVIVVFSSLHYILA